MEMGLCASRGARTRHLRQIRESGSRGRMRRCRGRARSAIRASTCMTPRSAAPAAAPAHSPSSVFTPPLHAALSRRRLSHA
eukprot:1471879-Prymnesium_polylepis.1